MGHFAQTLRQLVLSFASGSDLAFAEAAQEVQRVFAVDCCSIYSYLPAPLSLLSRVAEAGHVEAPLVLTVRPHSYLERTLSSDQPLLLDNVALQGGPLLYPGMKSAACVRTTYGGRSNGAVFLTQQQRFRAWTEREHLALTTIASQVGTALARDGLQQAERQQWEQVLAEKDWLQQEARSWHQARRQLEEHNRLLVKITAGYPAGAILQEVCWLGAALMGEPCGAAVLRYDPAAECFRYGAIANLPGAYVAATEGYGLEREASPWSEAARHECFLTYGDLRQAPLQEWYRLAALDSGFYACWSLPVFSEFGELLAAIALHHPVPRLPAPALRQSIEELAFLVRTVLERDRRQQRWQAEKEAAEESNRRKSQFLAHINHELRTPLNAIVGYTQLLLQGPSLPEAERWEYLEAIERSGLHLQNTIDDVLELSKIESGHLDVRHEPFSVRDTLDHLLTMFRGVVKAKGLALRATVAPDVPDARLGDSGKLSQVLVNLLGNAVKFTVQGEVALTVDLGTETSAVNFQVRDTGPGIAPADLPNLFEPFTQTPTGRKTSRSSGLGLAIARQLTEQMGGTLQVVSTVGQGTQFTLQIPLEMAPPPAAEVLAPKPEPALNTVISRVMIADDCPISRQLLRKMLTPLGVEIQDVANGQAALAVWQTWQPQLILLDLQMPDLDGYATAAAIRHQPQTVYPVIIAVSASTFEGSRARAIAAGCDEFVSKPFRFETVLAAIRQHLLPPSVDLTTLDMKELATALQTADQLWVQSLRDAAIVGDIKAMQKILTILPPLSPRYRQILGELVEDLRFDYLFAVADRALSSATS
ncbi:MAG: response regulator [Oscillatoriales cyanobacterium SM2_1_8]|nr:response regulator [Oscillatoriales cyanobacterium SM2_1_8]